MKTVQEIIDEAIGECGGCDFCDDSRAKLVTAFDEALAQARADERVKATAEAYEKVGRTFVPRGATES